MQTFFSEDDYRTYLDLLACHSAECGVDIWAYCLMPNHSHMVAVPPECDSLAAMMGEVHRRYSLQLNHRMQWKGHVWQGRFFSTPMDPRHTLVSGRYIEANPVRAGLVGQAWEWPWSSARAHLLGKDDGLVRVAPLLRMVEGDWRQFLKAELSEDDLEMLRLHERTGRPLGDEEFVARLEHISGRRLRPGRRGPRPVSEAGEKVS